MTCKLVCLSKVQKPTNTTGVPRFRLHAIPKLNRYSNTSTIFCPLGLKFKAPFFCHLNAMPFTKYQFSALLHKPVKFIGLYTTIFKSHSFGIGGATRLYLQGSSDEDIKSKGRWKFVHSILMVYAYDCNIIVL